MDTLVQALPEALASPKRNHYFYGKLLDELHLTLEQQYFNGKRWTLNRLALGTGVLCGLQVATAGKSVTVAAGVGIDASGREIIVPQAACVDPWQVSGSCDTEVALDPSQEHKVFLALSYCERMADWMPALVTDCDTEDPCAPSTIIEGFRLVVKEGAPPPVNLASDALCKALNEGADAADKRNRICEVLTNAATPCGNPGADLFVVLATMTLRAGGTVADLDPVTSRSRLCSNELLFEMLLCLKGAKGDTGPAGEQGQKGDKGDRGDTGDKGDKGDKGNDGRDGLPGATGEKGEPGIPGSKGDTGPGLETNLTHIVSLSWLHRGIHVIGANDAFVPVKYILPGGYEVPLGVGLVIEFDNVVKIPNFAFPPRDALNLPLFEVWGVFNQGGGGYTLAAAYSLLLATTSVVITAGRVTEGIVDSRTTSGTFPEEGRGLALLPLNEKGLPSTLFMVRLRGDFILDSAGKAIDARFPRAVLPSGGGPQNSLLGIQGGVFESWFQREAAGSTGVLTHLMTPTVSINSATILELATVPGIEIGTAAAILTARDGQVGSRFTSLDQLVGIGGIDIDRLKQLVRFLRLSESST